MWIVGSGVSVFKWFAELASTMLCTLVYELCWNRLEHGSSIHSKTHIPSVTILHCDYMVTGQ